MKRLMLAGVLAVLTACTGAKDACSEDSDCLDGNVCNTQGRCVAPGQQTSSSSSGAVASSSSSTSSGGSSSSQGAVSSSVMVASSNGPSSSSTNASSTVVSSSGGVSGSMPGSSAAGSSSSVPGSSVGMSSSAPVSSSTGSSSSLAPYSVSTHRVMAGQGIGLGPSPTGEHVAFVATTTNGYGTLHLAPTAAGSAQQLSNNVMFLHQVGYAFSSDGSWLTFLRDTGTSSNTAESAWLIPVNGGQGRQLGATVARNHLPRFTPDGQTVFFVDEASTTTGGRLRRHSTMFGTSTTLATGVMAFTLAPQGDQVAFTNNVNLANSTGTLNHYNVNTDDQYGLGSIKAVQFHHDGVRFLDNGTLLFVDNVTADHGTLKTRSTNTAIGTLNTNVWVHDIDTSPNAVRISYTRNGPQAGRYWGALAGGPAVRLGDPVSAFQLFDDDAMVYLNNVMGSPEYGDLTVVRAGGGSAVLATGVPQPGWLPAQAGRYMTYLANHDFGTGSGTLTRLDRTNNATQVLDTNAYDLTIWSPDSDHLAYLTAFDAAQDRGTLKVISAVTPGTPVVLSTSAQRYFTRMSPIPGRVVFLDNYNAATESGDLTLANVDGTGRVVLRTGFHLGNFWVDPLTVKNSDATGRYSVLSDGISSNDIWVLDWQEGVLTHVGTSVRNMTWAAGTHRLCYTVEEGADQGIWVAQFP